MGEASQASATFPTPYFLEVSKLKQKENIQDKNVVN
jgi:hypothetical protein